MKATGTLHDRGQSLGLDNITRELLESGTLWRYIGELAVTGLTSNPRSSTTRSRTAPAMTRPFARSCRRASRAWICSSSSQKMSGPLLMKSPPRVPTVYDTCRLSVRPNE